MSKRALKNQIKAAFLSEVRGNGEDPQAQIDRLADKITDAVYAHIVDELTRLKVQLNQPGAFTGSGTGTVVVSPGTIATYTPGVP